MLLRFLKICELARDGLTPSEVVEKAKRLLGHNLVLDGVEKIFNELVLDVQFDEGLRTIRIEQPIADQSGDLELAMYGSCLPVPDASLFVKNEPMTDEAVELVYPGKILSKTRRNQAKETIVLDEGEISDAQGPSDDESSAQNADFIQINKEKGECVFLNVTNLSTKRIKVGSHFNLVEANKNLQFDRSLAFGMRLNIPSGDFIEFEPKASKLVVLVKISGSKYPALSICSFLTDRFKLNIFIFY